jgi:hypothetical protein
MKCPTATRTTSASASSNGAASCATTSRPATAPCFRVAASTTATTLSVKDDLDVRQVRVQPMTPSQIEEFLRLYAPEHADGAWAEIRDNEGLLDLYSTPYFLKLLSDQLAYDPRVASERAALFTGFVRRALEREIAGRKSAVRARRRAARP